MAHGKRTRGRRTAGRRGSALLVALFVTMAVAALTVILLQMGITFNREVAGGTDDERALYLAEAGLAEAVFALRSGGSGRIGLPDTPATQMGGVLWVEVEDVGNDLKRLRSAAMVGSGRSALEQLVFHYAETPFTAALFSNQSLNIASNVVIDSFDSDLGSYASQIAALGGDHVGTGSVVLSNGDIVVAANTRVYGDVHSGEGASLTRNANTTIDGTTQSLPSPRPLPAVDEPVLPQLLPWIVPAGTSATLMPGVYGFTGIDVGVGGRATIRGPATIVVDTWQQSANSRMTFDTSGGPIRLYVSGNVVLNSNTEIVTSRRAATDLSLYLSGGAGQTALLSSNSVFYGAIYGPGASVDIRSNFQVYGAVAADRVIVNSNVGIHFDERLRDLNPANRIYEAATWSPTGFPIQRFLVDRRDPFQLLGRSRGELPAPWNAHDL